MLGRSDSFFKIHQPECEFEEHIATDERYINNILQKGKDNLVCFMKRGIFKQSNQKIGYVYRHIYQDRDQCGLLFSIDDKDFVEGRILPHEQTFNDKVARLHKGADYLGIYNSFPLAFSNQTKHSDEIDGIIENTTKNKPIYHITKNGVQHIIYGMSEDVSRRVEDIYKTIPVIYIADGHHRFSSYSK